MCFQYPANEYEDYNTEVETSISSCDKILTCNKSKTLKFGVKIVARPKAAFSHKKRKCTCNHGQGGGRTEIVLNKINEVL